MRGRLVTAAVTWALLAPMTSAQTGPAELPPAGFVGAEFVDSKGCAFQLAVVEGQPMWVARLTQDRKPLCGRIPSVASMAVAGQTEVAPEEAPAPGCTAAAPYTALVPLGSGGLVEICLTGDGQIVPESRIVRFDKAAPLSPQQVGDAALVCPQGAGVLAQFELAEGGSTLLCTAAGGSLAGLTLPKVQVEAPPPAKVAAAPAAKAKPAVKAEPVAKAKPAVKAKPASAPEAKAAPKAKAAPAAKSGAAKGHFVQVGSFVKPGNAARTADRLAELGLPVATGRGKRAGVTFQVVYAGPFADPEKAAATLALVKAAGFTDAFLR